MRAWPKWIRMVTVAFLIAVAGACGYVPSYLGPNKFDPGYKWIWALRYGSHMRTVDYGRVVLELIGLTAITRVVLLIGPLTGGRRRERSDPPTA